MSIIVTDLTLEKIDGHFGLDNYLLESHEADLHSKLGCKLKREILLSIARGADFHTEQHKKGQILDKYGHFLRKEDKKKTKKKETMDEEEIEWIGLDLNEACEKWQVIEEEMDRKNRRDGIRRKLEEEYKEQLRLEMEAREKN